jgi:hypothetical protein
VQAFVSYGRLVKGAKESAGKRDGTAGTKSGHASLTGACSEAGGLCRRDQPAGPNYLTRWEKKPGQGQALTVLAHPLARAVYGMLKRHPACAMAKCLTGEGSSAGAPDADLDGDGIGLQGGRCKDLLPASRNATERIGLMP